jgi:hypothetical protein
MEKKRAEEQDARQAMRQQKGSGDSQQPSRTVRFELASPNGKTFSVDAVGGSEDQLSGWLKSLERGRNTAQ